MKLFKDSNCSSSQIVGCINVFGLPRESRIGLITHIRRKGAWVAIKATTAKWKNHFPKVESGLEFWTNKTNKHIHPFPDFDNDIIDHYIIYL